MYKVTHKTVPNAFSSACVPKTERRDESTRRDDTIRETTRLETRRDARRFETIRIRLETTRESNRLETRRDASRLERLDSDETRRFDSNRLARIETRLDSPNSITETQWLPEKGENGSANIFSQQQSVYKQLYFCKINFSRSRNGSQKKAITDQQTNIYNYIYVYYSNYSA